MSEYLHFESLGKSASGKTLVYGVISVTQGDLLGHIRWYGPWRQYCFFPAPGTIWNVGCLNDINQFIARLMAERRLGWEPR